MPTAEESKKDLNLSQLIAQCNANQSLEGLGPDQSDMELQTRFIEGKLTADEMLAHAKSYVEQYRKGSIKL